MTKLASILLLSAAALVQPPAAFAAPPAVEPPPTLRLDDRARPTRMEVDLTLVPASEGFTGTARIAIELLRPSRVLWLNATGLTIDDAWLEIAGARRPLSVLAANADFVGFDLGEEAPAGAASLSLRYSGRYQMTETAGIFKQTDQGHPYLFTQFEATDARRAFPCFDEPPFKIPWQVTLRVPRELMAFSNSPVVEETADGGAEGLRTLIFAETPPMPSYLVAFAVGPFEAVDAGRWGSKKTPLRIVALKDRAADAAWAAEVTGPILESLEQYFGTPYPYAKLDSIAIPHTVGFGAMENAGLITYVDRLILIKAAESTEATRRAYADIAAHELAHMWFGDLVTMSWWDDIWLNEGFASWMGDRTIEEWKPEWGGGVEKVERRAQVMQSDFLATARQVRQPISSKDDIENAFDGITYRKGASLLTWFEQWMGPAAFQRGVRRYLERHVWGNATSADFLAALSEAGGSTIGPAFASFLDQPGVPLVGVDVRCQPGSTPRLVLTQRRFLPLGSTAAPERWRVPMRIRYLAGGKPGELRVLLTGDRADLALAGATACPEFLLANDGELGYYVAAYPPERFRALLADEAGHLTTGEQLGLLRDAHALTASGDLPFGDALAAAARAARSSDRQVVESALAIALSARDHLVPAPQRAAYARFIRETFAARAAALGFQPRPGESADDQLLRPKLLAAVADAGENAELRQAAGALARRWLQDRSALSAELSGTVLAIAALDGDAALFDALLAEAKGTSDRRDRRRLMVALGSFRDPALARRALALMLDKDLDVRESVGVLAAAAELQAGRQLAYDYIKENFDALTARLPETTSGVLPRYTKGFCDAGRRDDLERFYAGRSTRFLGGPRVLAQTLESITLCSALQAAQGPSVSEFLAGFANEPAIDQQREQPIGVRRR